MQVIAGSCACAKKKKTTRADVAYLGNNPSSDRALPVWFFRFATDRLARTAFIIMFG